MKKIILKNIKTNEILELEGEIPIAPNGWEIIKQDNRKKHGSVKKNANGDGSFYYSETLKKWIGQYGRKTITQRKGETKTQCKERWEKMKAEIKSGEYIERSKDTLYLILKKYIEQKFKDEDTTPASYVREQSTLKQIEKTCSNFINKPIQQVSIDDIEEAKEEIKNYSSVCIDKIWSMINKGFKIASSPSRKILQVNIMDDIMLKKPLSNKKTEPRDALTVLEEKKLRDILNNEEKDSKYRNIVLIQLNTGMRIGEILVRLIDDFDFKNRTVEIWNTLTKDTNSKKIIGEHTKNYNKKERIDKGKRTIPIDEETIEIVRNIKNSNIKNINNLLFWNYQKNTITNPQSINNWLKRINKKYEISDKELTTHILRHTKATRLRESGVPLPVIQYILGQVEGSRVTDDVYVSISLDYVKTELNKVALH